MRKFRWIQYDLSVFVGGTPTSDSILGSFIVSRQMMVPPLATDSYCWAAEPASSGSLTMYLELRKANNNYTVVTIVGSLYFAANTRQGVISLPQGINFEQGDMLQITTDSAQIPTGLSDISLTLLGFSVLRT